MNEPLNSDQIKLGYSAPDMQMALRNQVTLKWLGKLATTPDFELAARLVEREYAEWARLPVADVRGALDYITDQRSLDWMYERYKGDIE